MKYSNKTQATINKMQKIMKKQHRRMESSLKSGCAMGDKEVKISLKAHKIQTKAYRSI